MILVILRSVVMRIEVETVFPYPSFSKEEPNYRKTQSLMSQRHAIAAYIVSVFNFASFWRHFGHSIYVKRAESFYRYLEGNKVRGKIYSHCLVLQGETTGK